MIQSFYFNVPAIRDRTMSRTITIGIYVREEKFLRVHVISLIAFQHFLSALQRQHTPQQPTNMKSRSLSLGWTRDVCVFELQIAVIRW